VGSVQVWATQPASTCVPAGGGLAVLGST